MYCIFQLSQDRPSRLTSAKLFHPVFFCSESIISWPATVNMNVFCTLINQISISHFIKKERNCNHGNHTPPHTDNTETYCTLTMKLYLILWCVYSLLRKSKITGIFLAQSPPTPLKSHTVLSRKASNTTNQQNGFRSVHSNHGDGGKWLCKRWKRRSRRGQEVRWSVMCWTHAGSQR